MGYDDINKGAARHRLNDVGFKRVVTIFCLENKIKGNSSLERYI